MSIDIFSPRVMIAALREMKPARTFLRDKFFSAQGFYRTENVDIDTQVKGRRVAPFVSKVGPGKFVERVGFTTSSVTPPCVAMKTVVTAEDVSTRVMGEHVYENRDPATRGQQLLADDLVELEQMLARREELMCRDAIFTLDGNNSVITATGEDTSLEFTFARNSELNIGTLTSTAAWTHADSDPIVKLHEWAELYAKVTGLVATDVIFGGTAWQTFAGNAKVSTKMSSLTNINYGAIAPTVPDGARLQGALYGGGLRLWTYHEWYDDPDSSGTTTAMVPAKKIVMASDQLRTEMRYGAVRDLTDPGPNGMPTLVAVRALPRSWVSQDPPTRFLELRSRPLPVPIQNHFLTAQVQA
jgi:hypothetical protein